MNSLVVGTMACILLWALVNLTAQWESTKAWALLDSSLLLDGQLPRVGTTFIDPVVLQQLTLVPRAWVLMAWMAIRTTRAITTFIVCEVCVCKFVLYYSLWWRSCLYRH